MQLTVLFESPYWIALLEDIHDGQLYAARFIFGAEPNNEQVYEFVLRDVVPLLRSMTVGVPIDGTAEQSRHINPKRVQRQIARELAQSGVSTKAQEAIRLQLEQHKHERKVQSREQREAERERKRAIAAEKAKARHRGRA